MIWFSSKETGRIGEDIACKYLKNKGYEILARNYVPKWKTFSKEEIDIICEKDSAIIFVEVKTIADKAGHNFLPEDKVSFQKYKKIAKVAESYFLEQKISLDKKWQIDVVSVRIGHADQVAKIRHLKNISF